MDASTWDTRYAAASALWSRQANRSLVEHCPAAPAGGGRALDLGCGEGGDTRWLASNGWAATGVDFSVVAVERARLLAEAMPEPRPRYVVADVMDLAALQALSVDGRFELVTVCYQHPQPEDRARTYAHLPALVAEGGHLLILAHHPDQVGLDHEHVHEDGSGPEHARPGGGTQSQDGDGGPLGLGGGGADPNTRDHRGGGADLHTRQHGGGGAEGPGHRDGSADEAAVDRGSPSPDGPDPARLLSPEDVLEALGAETGLELVVAEVIHRSDAEGVVTAIDSLVLMRRGHPTV